MSDDPCEVRIIETAADMHAALAVRRAVFIEEQNVPESLEIDHYDLWQAADDDEAETETIAFNGSVIHVLAAIDGDAVGAGRMILDDHESLPNARVGRVAVLPTFRGRGIGRAIMRFLEEDARKRNLPGVSLAAQISALPFYRALGYEARGDIFSEADIPHRWMDLKF